jgi:hypothetical protein
MESSRSLNVVEQSIPARSLLAFFIAAVANQTQSATRLATPTFTAGHMML